jgi:hypothetical protein
MCLFQKRSAFLKPLLCICQRLNLQFIFLNHMTMKQTKKIPRVCVAIGKKKKKNLFEMIVRPHNVQLEQCMVIDAIHQFRVTPLKLIKSFVCFQQKCQRCHIVLSLECCASLLQKRSDYWTTVSSDIVECMQVLCEAICVIRAIPSHVTSSTQPKLGFGPLEVRSVVRFGPPTPLKYKPKAFEKSLCNRF